METAKRLTQTPGIGKPVEITAAGLRSWPVLGFEAIRIYYRQTPDSVDIVRVLSALEGFSILLEKLTKWLNFIVEEETKQLPAGSLRHRHR